MTVKINNALWQELEAEFPQAKVHPDTTKFLAYACSILDSSHGHTNVLLTDDLKDLFGSAVAFMTRPGLARSLHPADWGYAVRSHGLLSADAKVQTTLVDTEAAHQKLFATSHLIPMMKVVLGLTRSSSNVVQYPLVHEALVATRAFFGFGPPWDEQKRALHTFASFMSARLGVSKADEYVKEITDPELREKNTNAIRDLYNLLAMDTYRDKRKGQVVLTTGAQSWLNDHAERLLTVKAFLLFYYAIESYEHAGRIIISPNASTVKTARRFDVRPQDIVDCVQAHPVLLPLTGWDKDFSADDSMTAVVKRSSTLGPILVGGYDFLSMASGAVISPRRARLSSDPMAMQQLSLLLAIMSATDMTRSVEFIGKTPSALREQLGKDKAVIVERMAIGKSPADFDKFKKLQSLTALTDREIVLQKIINPLHTAKGAVHTSMYRGQGLQFYSFDNMTAEPGNVRDWVVRHGAYIAAWNQKRSAKLGALDLTSPTDFVVALKTLAESDDLPRSYRSLVGKWVEKHDQGVGDFLGSMPVVGEVAVLCDLQNSGLQPFTDEFFFSLEIPFRSESPFVVRLKGLGQEGYVVNIFVASPNAIGG